MSRDTTENGMPTCGSPPNNNRLNAGVAELDNTQHHVIIFEMEYSLASIVRFGVPTKTCQQTSRLSQTTLRRLLPVVVVHTSYFQNFYKRSKYQPHLIHVTVFIWRVGSTGGGRTTTELPLYVVWYVLFLGAGLSST